jgi:hypothetical protein
MAHVAPGENGSFGHAYPAAEFSAGDFAFAVLARESKSFDWISFL